MSYKTALEKIMDTLMVRSPGATKAALELELTDAGREFFREAQVWREVVLVNMIANRTRYEIIPDRGEVAMICALEIDGRPYRPLSGHTIGPRAWEGTYKVTTDFAEINIHPAPVESKPKAISALVALAPLSSVEDAPESLTSTYSQALQHGALGRIFAHVNKPYTNLALARYHLGRFQSEISKGRRIVSGGNVRAGGPWVFPQIAPGGRTRGGGFSGGY